MSDSDIKVKTLLSDKDLSLLKILLESAKLKIDPTTVQISTEYSFDKGNLLPTSLGVTYGTKLVPLAASDNSNMNLIPYVKTFVPPIEETKPADVNSFKLVLAKHNKTNLDYGTQLIKNALHESGFAKKVLEQQEKDMKQLSSKPALKKKGKAKVKAPKKPLAAEIFQWSFEGSKAYVAGTKTKYTTFLREDKSITCNCPGWIFKKSGQDGRTCKHVKFVELEASELYKKWKKGEKLPELKSSEEAPALNFTAIQNNNIPTYGRKIDLDLL